ncbi:MAG: membrane protein insertion efficiency factor YidD [Acidaminococcus sp.]|nr:membrane protein insertion efficiency factor YidD [Acidaminococcus sp.]MDD7398052.1 membrane protein insertion efficiency factor YidD [Bacillota bacterium]MDY4559063.1 membrane protein insertion efficiency factor YidD [Eubacteriales bacterium]MDY5345227.1 membrane protein insertion efficiency factor YidD [Eubacteriales bacterium]
MKYICFFLLKLYKLFISPITGTQCLYTPTCSMYMYDAISKHGTLKGIAMGTGRLLRCNPFSRGGFDPVPENYRGKCKWLI